jgi:altronate hydrolase
LSEFTSFTIQEIGGTRRAIAEGLDRLRALLPRVNEAKRTEIPASELVLALQCGGSDAWSGVTSNPALGNASDRLVNLGGTVILSKRRRSTAPSIFFMRARGPPRSQPSCARASTGGKITPRSMAAR